MPNPDITGGCFLWRAIPRHARLQRNAPLNLRGLRHDRLQYLRKSYGSGYVRSEWLASSS